MKKLGVICLVLIMAIGCVGIAYAGWSRTLTISGSVKTGTFDVVFQSFTAPGNTNGASFTATPVDSHTYSFTCNNTYPGLDAVFNFVLEDTGSVPAKITSIQIDSVEYVGAVKKDLPTTDGKYDIRITVGGIGTTGPTSLIDANNGTRSGSITVHTISSSESDNSPGADATPGASGSFVLKIVTEQRY
jgi:hypothetical protein